MLAAAAATVPASNYRVIQSSGIAFLHLLSRRPALSNEDHCVSAMAQDLAVRYRLKQLLHR